VASRPTKASPVDVLSNGLGRLMKSTLHVQRSRGSKTQSDVSFKLGATSPLRCSMGALKTYASRFGGLAELYKLVNYRGSYWTPESVRLRRTCSSMKLKAMTELQQAFVQAGLKATAGDRSFEISGKGIFLLELGQFHLTGTGLVRWKVKVSRQLRNHGVILIRLAPGNEDLKDFLFFRKLSKGRFFWLTDKLIPRGSSVRV